MHQRYSGRPIQTAAAASARAGRVRATPLTRPAGALIPAPVAARRCQGDYTITAETSIVVPSGDECLIALGRSLSAWIGLAAGSRLQVTPGPAPEARGSIVLRLGALPGREAAGAVSYTHLTLPTKRIV